MPSIRGGDAIRLMYLAALAFLVTGEDQYRRFVEEDLQRQARALPVAFTSGAFATPPWCRSFYGDHITHPPHWAFLRLLQPSPLRTELERVFQVEVWEKQIGDLGNAKFEVMYAGEVTPAIGVDRDRALAEALELIRAFGGNGGVLEDPRRSYSKPFDQVAVRLPAGTTLRCPTEPERSLCEDGWEVLGVHIPGTHITHECVAEQVGECPLEVDGRPRCATAIASRAIPPELRQFTDFVWQRSPFSFGEQHWIEGGEQAPGLDLTEPYWLARAYGFLPEGAGQVLAWEKRGHCE